MTLEELEELIATLMIDHGPDGHTDGSDIIAKEIFSRVKEWKQ